jgi:16S rRNA (uracil1498-N3)-methyltransferase
MDASATRSSSAHLFVDPDHLEVDGLLELDGDTVHHLRRVLRLRDGDIVSVSDGQGRWRMASVVPLTGSLALEPTSPVVVEPGRSDLLEVAVAIPKGDRVDWLVQKVTELGADRILLLHADNSVVRWKPERAQKQLARLQRIADEACRQSRRVRLLAVDGPVDARTVLQSHVVAEPGGRALTVSDNMVAIGPEGGWSPAELEMAADCVDLGPNILRTETAAVAITTLCVTLER